MRTFSAPPRGPNSVTRRSGRLGASRSAVKQLEARKGAERLQGAPRVLQGYANKVGKGKVREMRAVRKSSKNA